MEYWVSNNKESRARLEIWVFDIQISSVFDFFAFRVGVGDNEF
jgi:hypothetical protein